MKRSLCLAIATAAACLAQGTGKPDPGTTDVQEVRTSNLAFRLQKCHHEASLVTCDFTVTSLNSDTRVYLYASRNSRASSRIVTYEGTESLASMIQLADKDATVSAARISLVSGVVAKGQVSFNNVPQKPTKISLLKLQGVRTTDQGAGGIGFNAEFRNIALQ